MVQNIALSIAIIAILVPLAATGVLGLAAVVLVHELAEVLVIVNAIRAARTTPLPGFTPPPAGPGALNAAIAPAAEFEDACCAPAPKPTNAAAGMPVDLLTPRGAAPPAPVEPDTDEPGNHGSGCSDGCTCCPSEPARGDFEHGRT